MYVSDLIKVKGRDVVTVSPEQTLAQAAALLAKARIGAVVVLGGGRIAGILSERDIVRRLASDGADALALTVADAMTADVITCTMAETVEAMMQRMSEGKFRHLPVVDESGGMIGVISIGDVVRARVESYEAEARAMRDYVSAVSG
ncbi:MAG: CBS domain-containing protein [Pseudomonadota bacterium]